MQFPRSRRVPAAQQSKAGRSPRRSESRGPSATSQRTQPRAIGQLPEERALIERIISRGLVDLGRTFDPDNDNLFTWWPPWREMRARNIGWRVDYFVASENLRPALKRAWISPEVMGSDHCPVGLEIA
jgi:exodeoxyribonuclease-3